MRRLIIVFLAGVLAVVACAPARGDGVAEVLNLSDVSPIPDPAARSGTWERVGANHWKGSSGAEQNVVAVSEQRIAEVGLLRATVKIAAETPYAAAALVFRANADGSSGYAVALDPNLRRVRLFDLRDGRDLRSAEADLAVGRDHQLAVRLDGPRITVDLDGERVLEVDDASHDDGYVGLHVWNGQAEFADVGVRMVETNLHGWQGDPGWRATSTGLLAETGENRNSRLIATGEQVAETVVTTSVIVHSEYAVATLLARADEKGSRGYAVELDANQDRVRLYRVADNHTLATQDVTVEVGTVYQLTLSAEGNSITAGVRTDFIKPDDRWPALSATDDTVAEGFPGIGAWNGTVGFTGITLDGLDSTVEWSAESGRWQQVRDGLKGSGVLVSEAVSAEVELAADVTVAAGASLGVQLGEDPVLALDVAGERPVRIEVRREMNRVRVVADGREVVAKEMPAASGDRVRIHATGGEVRLANVRLDRADQAWGDRYRGAYHYSEAASSTSDPNGLVFLDGEYHLFHQDQGRWAHAVSTDLLHWNRLPIALDHNRFGDAWSGSAVVDERNASGLFDNGSGLIAYYTSFDPSAPNGNQEIRAAYSTDAGRSWQLIDQVIVANPGGVDGDWDFRDPKVTWDEAGKRWLMVVSGGDHIRFFASTDLLHWEHLSNFGYQPWLDGGVMECPDLFLLPVADKPGEQRWVLWWSTGAVRATHGSSARYVTGTFDGEFHPDTPAEQVLRADHGRDYYAAMSFAGLKDRTVMLGWMSNWDYALAEPTGRWAGQLSVPREIGLVEVPGQGLRLTQQPVAELAALDGQPTRVGPVTVAPGDPNALAGLSGVSYRFRAEVEVPEGGASEFALSLRTGEGQATKLLWRGSDQTLRLDRVTAGESSFTRWFADPVESTAEAVWPSTVSPSSGQRRVVITGYVDSSSVELFSEDGTVAMTSQVFPAPESAGLGFDVTGGTATLASFELTPLSATVPRTGVTVAEDSFPGQDRSGLGEFDVVPGGLWSPGAAGLGTTFDRDSTALGRSEYRDVTVEATVRFGTPPYVGQLADRQWGRSGAGSLVLRADAGMSRGYLVNVDPNLRTVRVLKLTDGGVPADGVLGRADLLVGPGASYRLGAQAVGDQIVVTLDGREVLRVTDGSYAEGRVGLNSFGGRATYNDIEVS